MPVQRVNGKKSPFVREGFFACEICGECFDRHSNSQKYCDECRQVATSRKVAEYYERHRKPILKRAARRRKEKREEINEKQRQYHQETKNERLLKGERDGA